MKNLNLAIVGASGLVGKTILKILDEEGLFDISNITLYVSSRSAGSKYKFNGREIEYIELNEKTFDKKFDVVFFSAGAEVSFLWAEKFAKCGAYVIDNTNAFRKNEKYMKIYKKNL